MNVLTVSGLHKRFVAHLQGGATRTVLRGADLTLQPGTLTVLRGPSGSGKSSLLRCIYRTYRPDDGTVQLDVDGRRLDLASAPDATILDARRNLLGMATQFLRVTPRVSAVDLVAEQGLDAEQSAALLRELGLAAELVHAPPATFSGGERQLVNVAISIARPRPLLLLDEATASLDPVRRRRVLDVLAQRKQAGTTMLAVFHDLPETPDLVDRVVHMRDGRVVA